MFCAYTRPRYQVTGPLVLWFSYFFSFFVAKLDLLHDVEAIHNLCKLLTAFDFFFRNMIDAYATANCIFSGITNVSHNILDAFAVKRKEYRINSVH